MMITENKIKKTEQDKENNTGYNVALHVTALHSKLIPRASKRDTSLDPHVVSTSSREGLTDCTPVNAMLVC